MTHNNRSMFDFSLLRHILDGFPRNVQTSIPYVGTIYPEFNISTVLQNSINFHSSLYTEQEYKNFIILLRKWQTIKDCYDWDRNTIKNKINEKIESENIGKKCLQVFDNIIIFDALTDKLEKLFKNYKDNNHLPIEKRNSIRMKQINYVYKNKEYIANSSNTILNDKDIHNIIYDIMESK